MLGNHESNSTARPSRQASHEIAVEPFEVAFLWPISLQWKRDKGGQLLPRRKGGNAPGGNEHIALADIVEEISGAAWKRLGSNYPVVPTNSDQRLEAETGYAEFCYLHPVVRHFMFANRDDLRHADPSRHLSLPPHLDSPDARLHWENFLERAANRNLEILRRTDIKGLSAEYEMQLSQAPDAPYQRVSSHFKVHSCWLYVFDTHIAVLELRLQHEFSRGSEASAHHSNEGKPTDLSLRMVMRLQDCLRRIYPAYWQRSKNLYLAGHCPTQVRLYSSDDFKSDQEIIAARTTYGTCPAKKSAPDEESPGFAAATAHLHNVVMHREPLASAWWRAIIEPLQPTTTDDFGQRRETPCRVCYEFVEDDRAITFSYVGVKEPRQLTTGDWLRMAELDDEGHSETYAYAPRFSGDGKLHEFAYNRYFDPTGELPAQDNLHRLRWLCSGYGFIGIGPSDDNEFFRNENSGALAHFRRHYFSLGLIAHLHRASLLRFKHELAETMESLDRLSRSSYKKKQFLRRLTDLLERMNQFRAVYWTREVSNQEQGRELFAMWRRKLDIEPLFVDVFADAEFARSVLSSWAHQRQAESASYLAILGAVFLVVAPALSIWTNSLAKQPIFSALFLAVALACVCFVIWFGRRYMSHLADGLRRALEDRTSARTRTCCTIVSGLFAVILLFTCSWALISLVADAADQASPDDLRSLSSDVPGMPASK